MLFCIAGQKEAGSTILAQKLSKMYSEYRFMNLEDYKGKIEECTGVIIVVNLMDGPMPGTRAAISDCKNSSAKIIGFCFTHLDEFEVKYKLKAHLKECVEIETRELASSYEYNDIKIPAIRISLVDDCENKIKEFFDSVLGYSKRVC